MNTSNLPKPADYLQETEGALDLLEYVAREQGKLPRKNITVEVRVLFALERLGLVLFTADDITLTTKAGLEALTQLRPSWRD